MTGRGRAGRAPAVAVAVALRLGLGLGLVATVLAPQSAWAEEGPAAAILGPEARQLVVVVTAGWNAREGTLTRFERAAAGEPWRRVGASATAFVGVRGMAWGRGLHGAGAAGVPPSLARRAPVKREGDKRAPAGAFRLGQVYGVSPLAPAGMTGSYVAVGSGWRCVDDQAHPRYNQVLDEGTLPAGERGWKSAEVLASYPEQYKFLVVVDHNVTPVTPGAGSCIFVHVGARATVGCTALAEADLVTLLSWLRPDAAVLVALPAPAYRSLSQSWGLPEIL